MTAKVKKYSAVIVLAGLILELFPAAFSHASEISKSANFPVLRTSIKIIVAESKSVISLPAEAGQNAAPNCKNVFLTSQNWTQDQALVNLHQPAGCLNLSVAQNLISQAKLSVKSLPINNQKIAVLAPIRLSADSYQPSPNAAAQSLAVMPIFVVAIFVFVSRLNVIASNTKKILIGGFKQKLSLEQLQIFRC